MSKGDTPAVLDCWGTCRGWLLVSTGSCKGEIPQLYRLLSLDSLKISRFPIWIYTHYNELPWTPGASLIWRHTHHRFLVSDISVLSKLLLMKWAKSWRHKHAPFLLFWISNSFQQCRYHTVPFPFPVYQLLWQPHWKHVGKSRFYWINVFCTCLIVWKGYSKRYMRNLSVLFPQVEGYIQDYPHFGPQTSV